MLQIKSRDEQKVVPNGDVFTVNPDGIVSRVIYKFSDIFADCEYPMREEWDFAYEKYMFESYKKHKLNKYHRKKQLEKQWFWLYVLVAISLLIILNFI